MLLIYFSFILVNKRTYLQHKHELLQLTCGTGSGAGRKLYGFNFFKEWSIIVKRLLSN